MNQNLPLKNDQMLTLFSLLRQQKQNEAATYLGKLHCNLNEPVLIGQNLVTPAILVARYNAHNVMEVLHDKGVDLRERVQTHENSWTTPALVAAQCNAHNVMAVLCEKGVNLSERIEAHENTWTTPALMAAQFNAHNVMAVLHEKGVNLSEAIQGWPNKKTTPALVAARYNAHNVMEVLHDKGVDLRERVQIHENSWTTPALIAAQCNAHNVMAVLCEKGVNLSERIEAHENTWSTPALVAAQYDAHNVMAVLCEKGVNLSEAIQAWPNAKITPALIAAQCNAHNVMAVLHEKRVNLSEAIQALPDEKLTPALRAARFNAHNVMAKLDAYGVNIYSCTESKIGDPNNALSTWLVAGLGTSQNKEQQKFSPPQEKLLQVLLACRPGSFMGFNALNKPVPAAGAFTLPDYYNQKHITLSDAYESLRDLHGRILKAAFLIHMGKRNLMGLPSHGSERLPQLPEEMFYYIAIFYCLDDTRLPPALTATIVRQLLAKMLEKIEDDFTERSILSIASMTRLYHIWQLPLEKAIHFYNAAQANAINARLVEALRKTKKVPSDASGRQASAQLCASVTELRQNNLFKKLEATAFDSDIKKPCLVRRDSQKLYSLTNSREATDLMKNASILFDFWLNNLDISSEAFTLITTSPHKKEYRADRIQLAAFLLGKYKEQEKVFRIAYTDESFLYCDFTFKSLETIFEDINKRINNSSSSSSTAGAATFGN